ncbi:hypothetical protein BDV27DRAFT_133485 [Aspergillus caelatus]|uniref:Zn(2)-C6 fungal-type domain-containing protein n=1 Tax=Aspergillus caelatus TaxID=61420 RepID=A0A5N6ZUQ7_9EURO|nr:uncharacterized protein BDV27DRAFT_133485 [Aspergillus caelatus]KAE8361145.1 hypothetical protein BDV27DRAFT_133485 [Aspergillus caelatus]
METHRRSPFKRNMISSRDPRCYACNECRVRKQKCSKDRPSCTDCSTFGRPCTYPSKQVRSPLQRWYVSYLESRLMDFESAFKFLFPGAEPDMLLESILAAKRGWESYRSELYLFSLPSSPTSTETSNSSCSVLHPDPPMNATPASRIACEDDGMSPAGLSETGLDAIEWSMVPNDRILLNIP